MPPEITQILNFLENASPWAVGGLAIWIFGRHLAPVIADWIRGKVVHHSVSKDLERKIELITNDNHHEMIVALGRIEVGLRELSEKVDESSRRVELKLENISARINGHRT